ncbi:hypothetical protein N865_18805 [Intrasporangium oryzae NRRL B-24470]|uniref:Uncharacterized protein n=1 Tax=Intrasporangium oryzae NRRL B-24470 TaxID=1386089 RepID=W9GEW1_9MICO|nr:hypothetical protein [Intrasporangium oryzae]EWT03368.1 hypothetical protein N865_18805 [Intrasporangium oryzae NRRL B-24470]
MRDTWAYDRDYLDACQSRSETQVAMWREVAGAARDHGDADVSELESALASLESEYFNNMLLVLDGYFAQRPDLTPHLTPDATGSARTRPGGAVAEVRVLARSLLDGGGTVLEDPDFPFDQQRSVLGLAVGDPIRLTQDQYRRLAGAFFREIERELLA